MRKIEVLTRTESRVVILTAPQICPKAVKTVRRRNGTERKA